MTPRQMAFVRGKLDGLSNRQAVIAAGYSLAGAKQQGTNLMKHPGIRAELLKGGFDLEISQRAVAVMFRRSAGRWEAASPAMPKRVYSSAIEFLVDAMNCEDLPVSLRIRFAAALLPYQHRKMGG
nr:terminase small subunit [Pseudoxanthomonas helianthi]